MVFQFIQTGYDNWRALAWGGAFTLLVLYLSFFILARTLVKEVRY
jgi:ABC-type phosphate transport system permease subunit